MGGAFLEWALEAFSGYAAVDELYEGPYCVLSAVDNRQYKRVLYEVLDHDPNHGDIEAFLGRLKRMIRLKARVHSDTVFPGLRATPGVSFAIALDA